MALPLILSGPILRRVEPSLVAVQVALSQSCTVKLSLWENQIKTSDAKDTNIWFRSPDPGAKSVRIGDQLHMCVVTVRLPEAKTLVPERLYSYDLELTPTGQTTKQNFKSLGLLANDPANADPDGDNTKRLALGYEVDLLPCVVLPPKELTDFRLIHGSCRDTDTPFPDGLAWLDDLLSGEQAYKSPLKRPHQLFLTGDQIYADEAAAPLIVMLNEVGRTLIGKEQLPIIAKPDLTKTTAIDADTLHFPPRRRHNIVVNEGGMTTTDGASHLMSFGEFCAMYLFVWNNEVWPEFPPFEKTQPDGTNVRTFELPADWNTQVGAVLSNAIEKRDNGELVEIEEYTLETYNRDIARLTELRRTLPKVRRALANIPTYMIFDDHEITDDWFLNPTWRDRVLTAPLGSAIIRNGMLAYSLFQGWGNDPVKFEPVTGATQKQPHEQLLSVMDLLENHYRDMQDFEFTIQDGKLYMLQTRNGKRTGPAAVRVAVEMVEEGLISKKEAVLRVAPSQLDQLLHPVFDPASLKTLVKLGTGIAASPGAAVGRIAFTAEDAVEMAKKSPVILLRKETTPNDIAGMDAAKGILTAVGGKSSHAAVVARGMGRPCIVGAGAIHIIEKTKTATVHVGGKTVTLKEGDWVSIDGTTANVYAGQAKTTEADVQAGYVKKFMDWVDEFRGGFGVRANADIPRDAKAARSFGAEGIGLCRTEHMFFAEERLPIVQEMILARDEKTRKKALNKLLPMQRKDFAGLFTAMNGFPVVIRTLDPPLHEFLPKREELMVDIAKLPHAGGKEKKEMALRYRKTVGELKKGLPELLHRVEELHEFNPMLGHRGCRLGITYPEITEMQARAIFEAVVLVAKKGIKVIPEVMIPLIGSAAELADQKAIVKAAAEDILGKAGMKDQHYMIGTMIEIPRAAITADKVAVEAEFFSFGTNDLTQTAMGLSRDDYTKFSKQYEDKKIFKADPFGVLDQEGVGQLIEIAVTKGRKTRPDLEVGICGEHGGEPSSVEFCYRVGMDYVSCSPYRVPIARLAAAQAAIMAKDAGSKSEQSRTA